MYEGEDGLAVEEMEDMTIGEPRSVMVNCDKGLFVYYVILQRTVTMFM